MYKQLPEGVETEEQREARIRKEMRGKSLAETNPYLQGNIDEALIRSVISSTAIEVESIEDIEEDLRKKAIKEDIKKVFNKEIKKKKGKLFFKKGR